MLPFANPFAQYKTYQAEINAAIQDVLNSGRYMLGEQVAQFELAFSSYLTKTEDVHTIGVGSGTDALVLALMSLDIGAGDEVILPSLTAVATASAVSTAGATPIFVDVDPIYYTLDPKCVEAAITSKTKAIIAVHLYGQPVDVEALLAIAEKHQIKLIEDCAQAVGARYKGQAIGTLADIACFSFFPTKNLGAIGDAGAVVTSDDIIANKIRMLRQYGWDENRVSQIKGINSRLDEIQAAILRVKLKYLDKDTDKRRSIADFYHNALEDSDFILPKVRAHSGHAYHLYVIQTDCRDQLLETLKENDIFAGIHYLKAAHQMPAYTNPAVKLPVTAKLVKQVLSLPMYPELTDEALEKVVTSCQMFAVNK